MRSFAKEWLKLSFLLILKYGNIFDKLYNWSGFQPEIMIFYISELRYRSIMTKLKSILWSTNNTNQNCQINTTQTSVLKQAYGPHRITEEHFTAMDTLEQGYNYMI